MNKKVSPDKLLICYNHGCRESQLITIADDVWQYIQMVFNRAASAADEREAIKQSIALLEKEAANYTPIGIDKPMNENDNEWGRQDCVDESTNTTQFLWLFSHYQLLKWYDVGPRVYRSHFIIDQHYAAQIIHKETGQRLVVDSWFLRNGEPPYIQSFTDWAMKKAITHSRY